ARPGERGQPGGKPVRLYAPCQRSQPGRRIHSGARGGQARRPQVRHAPGARRSLSFQTLGLDLDIYSSALKLNTQYMHTIHFNLKLRRGITKDEMMRRLQSNLRVA